jgi:hypothetical protein
MEIQVLGNIIKIPDYYQKVDSLPDDPQDSTTVAMQSSNAICLVQFFPISENQVMPYKDKQAVIDGIHNSLADDQGLVQIQHGWIYSKKMFMASIVRTVKTENGHPAGVQYTLTMHAKWDKKNHICIRGFFDEIGTTGNRDSAIFEAAIREGVINEDLSNVDEVWKNDPYDSNYRKGALSNLSEDYHYDEYFPMHPLTLCRNLITFIVRNN